jgi:hypothetical protein
VHIASPVDGPGSKADRGAVSLADAADAHDEPNAAGGHAVLIWVGHDARIAQGGTFNGVFTGKAGAEQEASGGCEVALRVKSLGQDLGVAAEGLEQVAVAPFESADHVIQRVLHSLVIEGKDPPDHCR